MMPRVTVSITTLDYPAVRQFHLSPEKAERFAARVRAEGGSAQISNAFEPSSELASMLKSVEHGETVR